MTALWPKWYSPPAIKRHFASDLIAEVAADYGITVAQLKSACRSHNLVASRRVVCKILRDRGLSFPVIGRLVGGRDHATVIHAVRMFDANPKQDAKMVEVYERRRDI